MRKKDAIANHYGGGTSASFVSLMRREGGFKVR